MKLRNLVTAPTAVLFALSLVACGGGSNSNPEPDLNPNSGPDSNLDPEPDLNPLPGPTVEPEPDLNPVSEPTVEPGPVVNPGGFNFGEKEFIAYLTDNPDGGGSVMVFANDDPLSANSIAEFRAFESGELVNIDPTGGVSFLNVSVFAGSRFAPAVVSEFAAPVGLPIQIVGTPLALLGEGSLIFLEDIYNAVGGGIPGVPSLERGQVLINDIALNGNIFASFNGAQGLAILEDGQYRFLGFSEDLPSGVSLVNNIARGDLSSDGLTFTFATAGLGPESLERALVRMNIETGEFTELEVTENRLESFVSGVDQFGGVWSLYRDIPELSPALTKVIDPEGTITILEGRTHTSMNRNFEMTEKGWITTDLSGNNPVLTSFPSVSTRSTELPEDTVLANCPIDSDSCEIVLVDPNSNVETIVFNHGL